MAFSSEAQPRGDAELRKALELIRDAEPVEAASFGRDPAFVVWLGRLKSIARAALASGAQPTIANLVAGPHAAVYRAGVQHGEESAMARSEAQPGYWPDDVPGGAPGVTDREEIGPIGAGTPHARMQWFWKRMAPHEKLVAQLTGWNPIRSDYCWEAAIADAFDRLAEAQPHCHTCGRPFSDPGTEGRADVAGSPVCEHCYGDEVAQPSEPTEAEVEAMARVIARELGENFDRLEGGKSEYLRAAAAALAAACSTRGGRDAAN